jgi:hypothetical protein
MRKRFYPTLAACMLILAILACNMPGGQSNNQPDLVATTTAQAQALEASSSTPAPRDTPVVTPSVPEVIVTSPTNCRSGPSTDYDLVFTMNPGQTAQVVGKNTPTGYWIINNPTGGTCWLWGQYAVVSGNTSGLPEYPPPPTPTARFTRTPKPTSTPKFTPTPTLPAPPTAPSGLNGTRDCTGGFKGIIPIWIESVTLTWQDNADNEMGYIIIKNGSVVSTLVANSTQYKITLRYNQVTGGTLFDNFNVEAFSDSGGSSAAQSVDVARCP